MRVYLQEFDYELGTIRLAGVDGCLVMVDLGRRNRQHMEEELAEMFPGSELVHGGDMLADAVRQLQEYLSGTRKSFDIPLHVIGTGFQKAVWRECAKVEYGRITTYGSLAASVGRPGAARAVGTALARNPTPLIVPCHRVVSGDGTVGGFSAGTGVKLHLLCLEGWRVEPGRRGRIRLKRLRNRGK